LACERLRQNKGFYAVFQTPEEFAVFHGEQLLGTLEILPRKDDHLLFAGKRWKVVEVNADQRQVHVVPARGLKRPKFTGTGGEVHPHVREKMKQVLVETRCYAYLDEEATSLLDDARVEARRAGVCERTFVSLGPQRAAFMTWTGTRIQETLQATLNHRGITCADRWIALEFRSDVEGTRRLLAETAKGPCDPVEIARFLPSRQRRRYDWLFVDELLDISNALGYLDLDGAKAVLLPTCAPAT
jgi:ATP-dependent Lhr-like helicase